MGKHGFAVYQNFGRVLEISIDGMDAIESHLHVSNEYLYVFTCVVFVDFKQQINCICPHPPHRSTGLFSRLLATTSRTVY
jgi:hypothetical protein